MSRHATQLSARAGRTDGIALIMVLIFTVLLYVLVAELVVTARMARLTGENDALMGRMHNHMVYTLSQVEEQLRDDLMAAAAEGAAGGEAPGGAGGLAALGGGMPGVGAGGEGEGGEEVDNADSSQDSWYEPSGYADDVITTYVWVEDENRKFNLLSLISPEPEFAEESRHRFIRLIDYMRDETEFDLTPSNGEEMVNAIIEWLEGRGRSEAMPRPLLKSDGEQHDEHSAPLHLDELLLLRGIDDDVFYDKVFDGKQISGLESVLTVYTSLKFDPGPPGANPGSGPGNAANAAAPAPEKPPDPNAPPEQPIGVGIRVNINTASRAVLRCLFAEHDVPNAVIDAILLHRNEEEEEEEGEESLETGGAGDGYSDLELGTTIRRKIFKTLEDLDELPEFKNLANPEVKEKFYALTSVQSDVFSVHMASMFKRNEERRVFVLRRVKSVLIRMEEGEEVTLFPMILLEERKNALRVMPVDFPDDNSDLDYMNQLDEMDEFAQEERRWNPFFVEFYRPVEEFSRQ